MNRKKDKVVRTAKKPLQLANQEQIIVRELDDVTSVVRFLEDFRKLSHPKSQSKSKLISIKIPESLLTAFKYKASLENIPYQTKIKELMVQFLKKS
jgi:predicted DNA binding CopG/RHH family protein